MDRLLRKPDVKDATGLSSSSIYKLMKAGKFPRAVQLTGHCVAWKESEIAGWIDSRCPAAETNVTEINLTER